RAVATLASAADAGTRQRAAARIRDGEQLARRPQPGHHEYCDAADQQNEEQDCRDRRCVRMTNPERLLRLRGRVITSWALLSAEPRPRPLRGRRARTWRGRWNENRRRRGRGH